MTLRIRCADRLGHGVCAGVTTVTLLSFVVYRLNLFLLLEQRIDVVDWFLFAS